jgi:gluconolactonase
LLFVDDGVAGNGPDIFKYDPIAKQFSKWPSNSTHCVGLTCDKNGNLIGTSSNILMMNKAGQLIKTLASGYNGKPFNNPNDLIADNKGGVYFTDPDFFVTTPPQDKTAVYYIDPAGNVKRVIDVLVKPNGLVLSPDGTKLYVVETKNKYVYSWDVASDGSVSGKLSLAELQTGVDSYADGMAVDIKGNIYIAGDKGIQVFSPQGVAITTIVLPEQPSNCDFGGSDFKTLYITAHSNLYSIDLNYPGYAVWRDFLTSVPEERNTSQTMVLYPNPAKELLHIKHSLGKVISVEILDMTGRKNSFSLNKVYDSAIEVNTQNLKPGMYLLKINAAQGSVTRKFLKE